MNDPAAVPPSDRERAGLFRATTFLTSANALSQLPPDRGSEVAFAGRSNAGKSSGLNAITGQKRLARISKTPGRTRLINYFVVAPDRYLVDLPGYGYARVPEAMRRHWQRILEQYLSRRRALCGLLLFMDIRHPLTALDRQLLDWCAQRRGAIASHVLLTKADKLKRGPALATLENVRSQLQTRYPRASAQLFSAQTGAGLDQAREVLERLLRPSPTRSDAAPARD